MNRYHITLGVSLPVLLAAAQAAPWRDTPVARLEALALIQTLNGELLASSSATRTLEQWCRTHALAEPAQLVARQIPASPAEPGAVVRAHLQVGADEPVRSRRVELRCGEHLLAVADNWYVPARLTPSMNRSLETTQLPFGKVVESLSPQRQTLAVTLLWSPLPEGWERAAAPIRPLPDTAAEPLGIPAALFAHQAIVFNSQHQPLAEVHEVYQRDLLDFPEPGLSAPQPQGN
jgi:hypothetical protein